MTVKSKKRRLARAHAHQAQSKGKDQFHRALDRAGMREKEDAAIGKNGVVIKSMRAPDLVIVDDLKGFKPTHAGTEFGIIELKPPSRTTCPECGFSQKVRKNGTMSRHDVFLGSDPRECAGTGKQWNSG